VAGPLENSLRIGVQDQGFTNDPVYRLAERTIIKWNLPYAATILDLGGGRGNFTKTLMDYFHFECVHFIDFASLTQSEEATYFVPLIQSERVICKTGDLNEALPYPDATFDAVISLEVIEHLENPRHFVREIARILKVSGRCLITTPNQTSLSSKLCLLLRDQFQQFQDSCYPAHITALLPIDLQRISTEAGLAFKTISYTDDGRIPGTNKRWQVIPFLTGKWFSDNVAIVIEKV
jgi:2-polyprenyl-3-methyl-5-hydroxy-6-metoxy-1,4-benzoquinol methylase